MAKKNTKRNGMKWLSPSLFLGIGAGVIIAGIALCVYVRMYPPMRVAPTNGNACEDSCYAAYKQACPVIGGFCPERYARIYYTCLSTCK